MADEKDEGRGPFHLGKRYDEVEPGLGRLHDAWHAGTGRPVLLLFPSDHVEWKPEGPWDVRFSCQPNAPSVTVMVDRSPAAPAELTELADILAMMSSAVQCVEDNPQARAHLLGGTVKPPEPRVSQVRGTGRFRAAMSALALAMLALGLCVWLFLSRTPDASDALAEEASSQTANAPLLSNSDIPRPAALSYPLPVRPFRNQAVAPCKPKPIEFEINGGCWMELALKPPCGDFTAEYQGKCYVPVSKDRSGGRLPQSSKP